MKYFSSKWAKFKKHPHRLTAIAVIRFPSDSNDSDSTLGVSKKTQVIVTDNNLHENLTSYLSDKIEPVPRLFVNNELTYFVVEEDIYKEFRLWCLDKKLPVPTRQVFHMAMLSLFPEPHGSFSEAKKTWHNFAFYPEGINEDDLRAKYERYMKKKSHSS
jgi:hypothetical protein